jgi:hypothetical protein
MVKEAQVTAAAPRRHLKWLLAFLLLVGGAYWWGSSRDAVLISAARQLAPGMSRHQADQILGHRARLEKRTGYSDRIVYYGVQSNFEINARLWLSNSQWLIACLGPGSFLRPSVFPVAVTYADDGRVIQIRINGKVFVQPSE